MVHNVGDIVFVFQTSLFNSSSPTSLTSSTTYMYTSPIRVIRYMENMQPNCITFKSTPTSTPTTATTFPPKLECSPCLSITRSYVKLSNLILTGSSQSSAEPLQYPYGGSIISTDSILEITDCTFQGNQAYSNGGTIAHLTTPAMGFVPSLTITNSNFLDSTSLNGGGGCVFVGLSFPSPVTLTNNTFSNCLAPSINTGSSSGGALSISQYYPLPPSPPTINLTSNTYSSSYACAYTQTCPTSHFSITPPAPRVGPPPPPPPHQN